MTGVMSVLVSGLSRWTQVFLTVEAKGVVLLALCALGALALHRSSAAGRHWVWFLGVLGLLALPVVQLVTPTWALTLPANTAVEVARSVAVSPVTTPGAEAQTRVTPTTEDRQASPATALYAAAPGSKGSTTATPGSHGSTTVTRDPTDLPAQTAGSPARSARLPLGAAFGAIWLVGTLALLVDVLVGLHATRRARRRHVALPDGRIRRLATSLSGQLGIRRPVELVVGNADAMPMSWGWIRPVVLLPRGAETWSHARLRAVLLHELAHIRRADCLTQTAAHVAVALHWINPLVWIAARRMRIEREYACDDLVLRAGARAVDYADELVSLARSFRPAPGLDAAAVAMARPSTLAGRLRAVLDGERRRTLGRGGRLGAVGVVVGLVSTLAALTPAPAPVADDPVAVRAPVRQQAECEMDTEGWEHLSQHRNNDRATIEWSKPGCEIEVEIRGKIDFTSDLKDIARMERGARLRMTVTRERTKQRLDVRPAANGAPSFAFSVDGDDRPFDRSARAWYGEMLVQLFRRGGFHAKERVAALLREGGVDAVLAELDLLGSDFVFSSYAKELVDQAPKLTESQALDVMQRTRRRVDSDFYKAEILKSFASGRMGSDRVVDELLSGAEEIESDFYRAEVLKVALDRGGFSPAQVGKAVAVAAGMDSDFYQSEVLTAVAGRYVLDPAVRRTYLEAVTSIESDFYRTQVLKSLLVRNELGQDEMAQVLDAAATMTSDAYMAQVLDEAAKMDLSSAALRGAYLRVATAIDSDAYRSGALTKAVEEGGLSADQVREVIEAAKDIDSDFYKAEVLKGVARKYRLEGDNRQALVDALNTIGSEFYRGQVAQLVLSR